MDIHQLRDVFSRSGFSLRDSTARFLVELESTSLGTIKQLHDYMEGYHSRHGISLYRHMNFLLTILEREIKLPLDLLERFSECLIQIPIELPCAIKNLYMMLWKDIADQTDSLALSYHNGFHGLEVSMRTMAGVEELGLFVGDDVVNQFLKCLLLIGAKYHDYIQWPKDYSVTDEGYHTAEEHTAMSLIPRVIEALGIEAYPEEFREPIIQFIEAFFPLIIGPGTTPIFGRDCVFNLSRHYVELRDLLYAKQGFPLIGKSLSYQLLVAIEVLNIADKAALACPAMIDREYKERDPSLEAILLPESSCVMRFLSSLWHEDLYYPDRDIKYNYYVFSMTKVSQLQMQLEFNRESFEAKRLRAYIQRGQQLYLDSSPDLKKHLDHVLSSDQITSDFELIYLTQIDKEINFFSKLADVCRDARGRLQAYRCLDEFGFPVYQWATRYVSTITKIKVSSSESMSSVESKDAIDFLGPAFIEHQVPLKETAMLRKLIIHIGGLEPSERKKIIRELLFFSMTQPGVYYTNHPCCITAMEPISPLVRYAQGASSPKPYGFAKTPYGSFSSLRGTVSLDEGNDTCSVLRGLDLHLKGPN